MKKIISILLSVILLQTLHSQTQRLAVLPGIGKELETVCIDFFSDIPATTDELAKVLPLGNEPVPVYTLNGTGVYSKIAVSGADAVVEHAFIAGTGATDEFISDHYKYFIKDRIEYYVEHKATVDLQDIQDEIWEYDVLKHLEYLNESGSPSNAIMNFTNAKKSFEADFGTIDKSFLSNSLLAAGEQIHRIAESKNIAGDGYRFLYVAKNADAGKFVVFDDIGSPLYSGSDKAQLADLLSGFQNNDNVNIYFNNYETQNTKKAFMTDLSIQFRLRQNKELLISEYEPILHLDKISHRINMNDISTTDIIQITVNGQPYFKGSLAIESLPQDAIYEMKSTISVKCASRLAVRTFYDKAIEVISTTYTRLVLARALSNIKAVAARAAHIPQNQLKVYFSFEGRASRITKGEAHDKLWLCTK
jgi:hypothetical protein